MDAWVVRTNEPTPEEIVATASVILLCPSKKSGGVILFKPNRKADQ